MRFIYLGDSTFRTQLDGKPLPSARLVSLNFLILGEKKFLDRSNNELLVPWGQFLTHDISFYPDDIRNATTPGITEIRVLRI